MTDQVVDRLMAGADDGAPSAKVEKRAPAEAAQVLQAILETGNLRYWIIFSWAVALGTAVGPVLAVAWFAVTMAAGYVRGQVEKQVVARTGSKYAPIFVWVAFATTFAWASAPLLAWFAGGVMGPALAIALLCSGYVMVFTQMRTAPREAFVISAPYSLAAVVMASTLWGDPGFWTLLAAAPVLASALLVKVIITMMKEAKIQNFQAEQARLIEELETARDRANAANDAKSSFLGVISHELRTPMNGVLGAAQLLAATRLEPAQKGYLSIIRNSGDNLLSLLNDILDMTKIEAGKMTFEVIDVSVPDLHRRVTGPFQAQAEAKGLDFVAHVEGDVPAIVRGDPLRVCQVIHNLLSNAVKFTESGGVSYTCRAERTAFNRVMFAFSVKDSGAGIAPDDLARLFQPFTQVDASSTRRFGGTGLGLTIAKRMANIMGGDITVESTVGEGSTFTFTCEAEVVQWAAAEAEADAFEPCDDAQCLQVLVVEDHPVNRMILEAWMGSAGHTSATAENGEIAVGMAGQDRYDLIVMDVNMPVMDGLTATRAIRAGEGANRDTPIVVLSASARHEDHEAGLEAGADAYLNKPIDFAALAQVMARVGGGRHAVRALVEAETATARAA